MMETPLVKMSSKALARNGESYSCGPRNCVGFAATNDCSEVRVVSWPAKTGENPRSVNGLKYEGWSVERLKRLV